MIRLLAPLLGLMVALACSPAIAQPAPAPTLELLVPAYFYPSRRDTHWPRLIAAARQVPVTAILNPASGPGSRADSNYLKVTAELRAAGGRVLGYVHTSYGERALSDVVADVDRYAAMYPIDGIFIDEMANDDDTAHYLYYQAIHGYIKALNPQWRVIGNPGAPTQALYLSMPAADVLNVFEDKRRAYVRSYWQPDWVDAYPASRFAHLVVSAAQASAMRDAVSRAVSRRAGWVYVTDDGGGNPWNRLPSYWAEEIACVEAINAGQACR
ncbi:MAG: spherulation-specific family 4 protein [Burkholderiaceae bacterium]